MFGSDATLRALVRPAVLDEEPHQLLGAHDAEGRNLAQHLLVVVDLEGQAAVAVAFGHAERVGPHCADLRPLLADLRGFDDLFFVFDPLDFAFGHSRFASRASLQH